MNNEYKYVKLAEYRTIPHNIAMNTIDFTILPPPTGLERDVECIRVATRPQSEHGTRIHVCPSGLPGLVFHLTDDKQPAIESIAIQDTHVTDLPPCFIYAAGTHPSVMTFRDQPYTTIQFVFKPFAPYMLFGPAAAAITQRGFIIPADLGAANISNQLITAPTTPDRIHLITSFLTSFQSAPKPHDTIIEASIHYIDEHIDTVTISDLLDQADLSERQFQKRFARAIGILILLYIRIRRANKALQLMAGDQYERLSDIAHAVGYYDQSHFIREIKTFSWVTPTSLTQKVSEFHQDLAGASYL